MDSRDQLSPFIGIRQSRIIALVVVLLLCTQQSPAQNVTEPPLKAAVIHNLAKYTAWPADALPAQAPFLACVLGNRNVADALAGQVKGRMLSNRPIMVLFVTPDTALRSCHLLYISAVTVAQAAAALTTVRGAPTLSIVDIDNFKSRNTIVRIFVGGGTVKFDIDVWLARRSRLEVSSQVLSLASRVYTDPDSFGPLP